MAKRPADLHAAEIIGAFECCECARLLNMNVTEAGDHGVRVTMDTGGKLGPGGVAHGGAVFTLADHAFGIAANIGKHHQVALSATIQYIAPATGILEAFAERIGGNDMCSVYRVTVSSGGKTVAVFEGVGIKVP